MRGKRRGRVFLGYAVFHSGEPFPCSPNTVTKDKLYLKRHALLKLNLIHLRVFEGSRDGWIATVERIWRSIPKLTLRRVYAE